MTDWHRLTAHADEVITYSGRAGPLRVNRAVLSVRRRLPLYPYEQTSSESGGRSHTGQQATSTLHVGGVIAQPAQPFYDPAWGGVGFPLAREQRRLAAIVAADVVGYSRLMGRDESGTLARLREHRKLRFEPTLARHGGRLVKLTGDGALAEFPSAVDALSAAIEFQQAMAEANRDQLEDTAIVFRIGLHLGDLIVDGDDLYGDGVNVAARLEGEAPPGGILISRNVHDAVAGRLKATFDDLGELALKNIERPVRVLRVGWQATDWSGVHVATAGAVSANVATARVPDQPLALPDKPSIAVLPFANMSGDTEQEYFADGITEDIITELARFRSLFVIARNSTFTYKGRAIDVRKVSRELGVRYVLEGSVRKAGHRVRITGQLIQADTGAHIWAERYDGDITDIFDLQDRVTLSVVGAIAPKLEQAEIERVKSKATENLGAYDHYLRGLSSFHTSSRDGIDEALLHFQKAVELDPTYAAAYGMAAYCWHRRRIWGWSANYARQEAEMEDLIRQAVRHGKDDPLALATAGFARAFLDDLDAGAALIDRACQLNPNDAMACWMSAIVRAWLGDPETAIDLAQRAIRLSPFDPLMPQMLHAIANAHFVAARYDQAATVAFDALHIDPQFLPAVRLAAATCGLLGRRDEAYGLVARFRESFPYLTLSSIKKILPFRQTRYLEAYIEGLRLAGLPE